MTPPNAAQADSKSLLRRIHESRRKKETDIIVIVGTGVSASATGNLQITSWPGLLRNGVEFYENYCRAKKIRTKWKKKSIRNLINSGIIKSMLEAASQLEQALVSEGIFGQWLSASVGSLQIQNSALTDALCSLGFPMITTNYDGVLEQALNTQAITWNDHQFVDEYLKGNIHGVLHIHGHFSAPKTVVLGNDSYDLIKKDQWIQAKLLSLLIKKTILFIGVGDGLDDPNFHSLIQWIVENPGLGDNFHYLFVRNSDEIKYKQKLTVGHRIKIIPYGEAYTDLPSFIQTLNEVTGPERMSVLSSRISWRNVAVMQLPQAIDVLDPARVQSRVSDEYSIYFCPPSDHKAIIKSLRTRQERLSAQTWLATIQKTDTYPPSEARASESWKLFNMLVGDRNKLENAKRVVFEDYIGPQRTIKFNGQSLGLAGIQQSRTIHSGDELPTLRATYIKTDYYSYRVMTELQSSMRGAGISMYLSHHLAEYFASFFQHGVHLGTGVAIFLHTLQDNRLVVTRRSANATNTAGEAGKLFMSANEGVNRKDINPNGTLYLRNVVYRALREEIIGGALGNDNLPNRIRQIRATGAYIYMPTLSVDLCLYVSIDCSLEQIRVAYPLAPDSQFETSGIYDCPKADMLSIEKYVSRTVNINDPSVTWDEGALASLLCTTVSVFGY